jgi:inosine triphosphate pyrophosphatase
VPEVQGSIEEVAKWKCREAARLSNGPVITEDTALCFDALNSLPGPYIKWFLESVGLEGLNDMLVGFESKTAKAVCTMAYCAGPDTEPILFQGITTVSRDLACNF